MSDLLMCRTCVSTPPRHNLLPLFDRPELHRRYSLSLQVATGLQIKMNDGLPQHICTSCSGAIKTVLRFRKACRMAHKVLSDPGFRREMAQKAEKNENEKSADDFGSDDSDEKPRNTKIIIKIETDDRGIVIDHFNAEVPNTNKSNTDARSTYENLEISDENDNTNDDLESTSNYVEVEIKPRFDNFVSVPIDENVESSLKSDDFDGDTKLRASSNMTAKDESEDIKKRRPTLSLAERAALLVQRKNNVIKKLKLMRKYLDVSAPLYTCKLCKKRYQHRNALLAHTQVHTGLEFMCEQCSKAFQNSTSLCRHQRAMHGAAPDTKFKCPHCDFYGRDNSRLKEHVRKHTGERPYVCDTCAAGFRSQELLNQHLSRHITEKTLQCDQCPSKFASRYHLKDHRNRMHKPRRWSYQCPHCSNVYNMIGSCRKHMRNSHGIPLKQQGNPVRVPSGLC